MTEFEDFIRKEREELSQRRDELNRQKRELDRQIQEIERQFAAIDAYDRVRRGEGEEGSSSGSRRRTGVRQTVLGVVRKHPHGITRADILEEMHAKGNKKAEQSISNALSNLKKQGQVNLDQGSYTVA